MKTLFLVNNILEKNTGIGYKILAQFDAFRKINPASELCFIEDGKDGYYRKLYNESVNSPIAPVFKFKEICYIDYRYLLDVIKLGGYDVIYIRYSHFSNRFFLSFLRKLKDEFNISIVLEIPHYPYDEEYKNGKLTSVIKLFFEKRSRIYLHHYVDFIATMGRFTTIYDIPVIQITNAVSIDSPIALLEVDYSNINQLRFVAVANLANWHGYDRFISSFASFCRNNNYDSINFHFDIIGDGSELSLYKSMVSQLDISDCVTFHGLRNKGEVSVILSNSNIGIDSLGRHRVNSNDNDSLKSKEYLVHGLPVVKSHIDTSIDALNLSFDVPMNDSDFDVSDIVEWYLHGQFSKDLISKFSFNEFNWDNQLVKVFKHIKRDIKQ